ncbi:MAG: hypothetical protein IPN11_03205 [Opitutaceae bacterium]|nr:hypothetical protein [Opitutaceae bacterium]
MGVELRPSGTGVIIIQARQDGDYNHDPALAVERMIEVTTSADAWQTEYFLPAELADPAISGPAADPDGDGLVNLVEYALGLQPRVGTTLGVPEVSADATDWIYTYTKPVDRSDLTYAVEVTTDLITWGIPAVTPELVATVDGIETWRVKQPLSSTNVFFRLKVTQE